jgi:hypothetical protein
VAWFWAAVSDKKALIGKIDEFRQQLNGLEAGTTPASLHAERSSVRETGE